VACRLHAVLCQLIPGGVSRRISAAQAAHLLGHITPSGAVQAARCELAAEFLADLRRIDAQMYDAKKKLTMAVRASATTLTEVFGVGPIVAATVIGEVRDVSRFCDRDHFAACNGTTPIEVSSGRRKIYRLSHLREMYGVEVSADLISGVADGVVEELAEWQSRPLDAAWFLGVVANLGCPWPMPSSHELGRGAVGQA
jgi:Transposase IS116/IS110/IS902 family/Transposase, Mutator family